MRKLCLSLAMRLGGDYGYLVRQPVFELLNICADLKELLEEAKGG